MQCDIVILSTLLIIGATLSYARKEVATFSSEELANFPPSRKNGLLENAVTDDGMEIEGKDVDQDLEDYPEVGKGCSICVFIRLK